MATLEASPPRTMPREGRFVNEPFCDFTREENARQMRAAVEKLPKRLCVAGQETLDFIQAD